MVPERIKRLLRVFCTSLLLIFATELMAQEHSYAPADIDNGRGLFQANCLGCHGDAGDAVDGANLSTGRFRRASSDEDLIRLIRTGIAGTPMPPHTGLSVGQVRTIVAFLRALPTGGGVTLVDDREVKIGNALAGEALFNGETQCSVCHGVNGGGLLLTPDLGGIGAQRSPGSLEQSILEPAAEVRAGDRFFQITKLDGTTVTGKLLNQGTHSVQLMNEDEKLVSFLKSELSDFNFVASPMPSYLDILNPDEVADLVAYMISLKGENAQ